MAKEKVLVKREKETPGGGREQVDFRTGKPLPPKLNAAQEGGASGVGFETPENQAAISEVVSKSTSKGGSKAGAADTSYFEALANANRLKRQRINQERRNALSGGGRLATDNLSATQSDIAEQSFTQQGARSSTPVTGGKEDSTLEGGGNSDALTDAQIAELEGQGYFEGDYVPGKGYLTPLGTFNTTRPAPAKIQTDTATNLKNKDQTIEDNITVSDETVVNEETTALNTVNDATKVVRDLTYIDDEIDRLQETMKDEIKLANEQYKIDKETLADTQSRETGQQSVALANAGGYLGYSGSATGVLLNLAKSHRAELQALDAKRQKAIFDARTAAQEGMYDLVRLKAQELKDIEQEEYNRKEDYLAKQQKINEEEAAKKEKVQTQNDIFNAIKMGSKTPEAIFTALGGQVDIATISKFLSDVDAGEGSFKFSATQNASLLGSGMSMDDISALKEYVSENGYDETIKSMLTPTQRVAVEKIFKSNTGTGTGAGDFTAQEKLKLEQAGLLNASRKEQLDYLYADEVDDPYESVYTGQVLNGEVTLNDVPFEQSEDVRNELLDLGFGTDVVPQWYRDYVEASENMTLSGDSLKSSWSNYRKKALGEVDTSESKPFWSGWFN